MASELTPLNKAELSQLRECEAVIERGQKTFIEVGNALATIKEGKLYKAHYKTFEKYCKDKWGYTKSHAYRMIESAQVVENLSPMGDKNSKGGVTLPKTEREARPLAQLETPKEQAKAWAEVVKESEKTGEPITAAAVEAVVERHLPPPPAPEPSENGDGAPWENDGESDEDGPIAAKIKATKEQRAKFAEFDEDLQAALLASILAGRQTLRNAIETGEVAPLTIEEKIKAEQSKIEAICRAIRKVFDEEIEKLDGPWAKDLNRKQGAIDKFAAVLETIRSCKPAEPCPRCKGDAAGCKDCHKTGMVTRNAYQQLV
jgi:hypothetical protein